MLQTMLAGLGYDFGFMISILFVLNMSSSPWLSRPFFCHEADLKIG